MQHCDPVILRLKFCHCQCSISCHKQEQCQCCGVVEILLIRACSCSLMQCLDCSFFMTWWEQFSGPLGRHRREERCWHSARDLRPYNWTHFWKSLLEEYQEKEKQHMLRINSQLVVLCSVIITRNLFPNLKLFYYQQQQQHRIQPCLLNVVKAELQTCILFPTIYVYLTKATVFHSSVFLCKSGVQPVKPGMRSCYHVWVTDPVTSNQGPMGKSAAVTLRTSTLSPLSSSAPSWSVLKHT